MKGRGAGVTPTQVVAVAIVALLAATVLVEVGGSPGPRAGSPGTATTSSPFQSGGAAWDNGVIRLSFPSNRPAFVVSALNDSRVASSHSLTGIAELAPSGGVLSFAYFDGPNVSWAFASTTDSGGRVVWQNATVPVYAASGEWESGDDLLEEGNVTGTAQVALTYYLNGSAQPAPSVLRFAVNVTGWPWTNASDALGLAMKAYAVPSTHYVAGTSATQLLEVTNESGTPVSTLSWDSDAAVRYSGGAGGTSTVGTYRNVTGGYDSNVRLLFGSVTGGYSELSYDPAITLNLAAFGPGLLPAWVITQNSLLVIAFAAAVVIVLAGVARRSRSKGPSPP